MSTQTETHDVAAPTERARVRHIYRGFERHPAPRGAIAYCGHVKESPPGDARPLINGAYGDTCVVCWELARR